MRGGLEVARVRVQITDSGAVASHITLGRGLGSCLQQSWGPGATADTYPSHAILCTGNSFLKSIATTTCNSNHRLWIVLGVKLDRRFSGRVVCVRDTPLIPAPHHTLPFDFLPILAWSPMSGQPNDRNPFSDSGLVNLNTLSPVKPLRSSVAATPYVASP